MNQNEILNDSWDNISFNIISKTPTVPAAVQHNTTLLHEPNDTNISFDDSIFLNESTTNKLLKELNTTGKTETNTLDSNTHNGSNKTIENNHVLNSITTVSTAKVETTITNNDLSAWGLPDEILEQYRKRNIITMFHWQVECLRTHGVLDEQRNLVYSAPTSAGKTLVAEILSIKTVVERKKKVIFILPYISVVREKMLYFQDILGSSGIRVEGFMGSYNPPGGFQSVQVAICTMEKANGLINKMLEENSVGDIGAVVVDEIHMLGDPSRGYLLELLLTKLLYVSKKENSVQIQIIGMSATLPNLSLLAKWLDASLYVTTFRPIPLNEMCHVNGEIFNSKMELQRKLVKVPEITTDSDNILQLCLETLEKCCSVLIFCPTKNWCENLAMQISKAFSRITSAQPHSPPGLTLAAALNPHLIEELLVQLRGSPVGLDAVLQTTIAHGVAHHHAGLTIDERDIVEGGFRRGALRVLVATSTLSSGVNLPARRVIVRSAKMAGGRPLEALAYRQMIGRAGRMGKDTEGESVLVCQKGELSMVKALMAASLEPVKSCLEGADKLKRAILEVISSGVATTDSDVALFTSCTLLAISERALQLVDPITEALDFLISHEFVRRQSTNKQQSGDNLRENGEEDQENDGKGGHVKKGEELTTGMSKIVATPLGKACLSSSMAPDEGLSLFAELERARRCFVLETELHLIYLVTPYSICNHFNTIDWFLYLELWEQLPASMKRVGQLVGIQVSFLLKGMRNAIYTNTPALYNQLLVHKRFYIALALQELVAETPLAQVAARYQCNRGLLQSLQLHAATFAGMVTAFSRQLGWSTVELLLAQFQDRLQFGVSRDLLDLMRLPLMSGLRARVLHAAGVETVVALARMGVAELENVLHKAVPFQSSREMAGESKFDAKLRNKVRCVWITGREGLTEREAAILLIQSAREYLQLEMGVGEAKWETLLDISKSNSEENGKSSEESVENDQKNEDGTGNDRKNEESSENDRRNEESIENDNNKIVESTGSDEKIVENAENDKRNQENTENDEDNEKNTAIDEKSAENNKKSKEINDNQVLNDSNINKSINQLTVNNYKQFSLKEIFPEAKDVNYNETIINELQNISNLFSEELFAESQITAVNLETKFGEILSLKDQICDKSDSAKKGCDNSSENVDNSELITENDYNNENNVIIPEKILQNLSVTSENLFEVSKQSDFELSMDYIKENFNSNINLLDNSDLSNVSFKLEVSLNVADNNQQNINTSSQNMFNDSFEGKFNDINVTALKSSKENVNLQQNDDNCVKKNDNLLQCDNNLQGNGNCLENNESDLFERDSVLEQAFVTSFNISELNIDKINEDSVKKTQETHNKSTNQPDLLNITRTLKRNRENGLISQESDEETINSPVKKKLALLETKELVDYNEIKIIDVCKSLELFKTFSKELLVQNTISLSLSCVSYEGNAKVVIGAQNNTKEVTKKENFVHKNRKLTGLSFSWGGNIVYYLIIGEETNSVGPEMKMELLKHVFDKKELVVRLFDCKEQIKLLKLCLNIDFSCLCKDPKVADWLLQPEGNEKNLQAMCSTYCQEVLSLGQLAGLSTGVGSISLDLTSSIDNKIRSAIETCITWHLLEAVEEVLQEQNLYFINTFDTEMSIMLILARMELAGIGISRGKLQELAELLRNQIRLLENRAYSLAGRKFNFGSPKDVAKVLGLDKGRKRVSTSKQVLEQTDRPLAQLILMWRKLTTTLTHMTYPLLRLIDGGRIFGNSVTHTATGRITMHEPNMQNVPRDFVISVTAGYNTDTANTCNSVKSDSSNSVSSSDNNGINVRCRRAFVCRPGNALLSADYCQLELRLLTHLSGDCVLGGIMRGGGDVFRSIAARWNNIKESQVTDGIRQSAKKLCYGIIYGMGTKTIGDQLSLNEEESLILVESFHSRYPGIREYIKKTVEDCRESGYVETIKGRRRYLPNINHLHPSTQNQAERQAVNTTIQGSAADITKTAMVLIDEKVKSKFHASRNKPLLVLQIHDELLYEVPEKYLKVLAKIVKQAMENSVKLSVPFPVKLKTGKSWGDMEEFIL